MSPRRSPMTSSFSVVRAWDMHTRNASVLTNTPRKPLIVNLVFFSLLALLFFSNFFETLVRRNTIGI
jgi:hypothetical protein